MYFSFLTECRTQEIAFLLDGSGSVDAEDFYRMKTFVKNLVGSFQGQDTKVGLYSKYTSALHVTCLII